MVKCNVKQCAMHVHPSYPRSLPGLLQVVGRALHELWLPGLTGGAIPNHIETPHHLVGGVKGEELLLEEFPETLLQLSKMTADQGGGVHQQHHTAPGREVAGHSTDLTAQTSQQGTRDSLGV